jgi:hypothetical protein
MITSNAKNHATLFYFNSIDDLADFESFMVCPVHAGQQIPDSESEMADFWCVMGVIAADDKNADQGRGVPVADLPTRMYANLFAEMCARVSTTNTVNLCEKTSTATKPQDLLVITE